MSLRPLADHVLADQSNAAYNQTKHKKLCIVALDLIGNISFAHDCMKKARCSHLGL
jgi:hypothetical protein